MSYADISTSSLELFPVLFNNRPVSEQKSAVRSRALTPRRSRPQFAALMERGLYVMLAVNFAVMVYGFIGMIG